MPCGLWPVGLWVCGSVGLELSVCDLQLAVPPGEANMAAVCGVAGATGHGPCGATGVALTTCSASAGGAGGRGHADAVASAPDSGTQKLCPIG